MKILKILMIFSFLITAVAYGSPAHSEEDKHELTIAVYMTATGALAETQQYEYAKAFFGEFGKRLGYDVRVMRFAGRDDMVRNFTDGNIDIASFSPEDYIKALQNGVTPRPLISIVYKGKSLIETSFFHREDLKVNGAQDMVGKTMVYMEGLDFMYFTMIRARFFQEGVDIPLWEVFPEAFKSSGGASPVMALQSGMGDVLPAFSMVDAIIGMSGGVAKSGVEISMRDDSSMRWPVMAVGPRISDVEYRRMRESMKDFLDNIEEYEKDNIVMRAMNRFMKQLEIRTVVADEDHIGNLEDIYEDAEKRGWMAESKYLARLMLTAPPGRKISLAPTPAECERLYSPDDPDMPYFCAGGAE